jgi:hypothetical protein
MAKKVKKTPGLAGLPLPKEVKIDYIKSNFFRVVHGDGVFGGVSPHGKVFLTIWSARPSIPQTIVHGVNEDGTLGNEIREARIGRDAMIREAEVGILMDVDVAKSFVKLLQERVKIIEAALQENKGNK